MRRSPPELPEYRKLSKDEVPEEWHYLFDYVPGLAYWEVEDDYRRPDNVTGHVQRAYCVYWSVVMRRRTGGVGLDIGCGNVISPFCIGLDVYADRRGSDSEHPVYGGGGYRPHVQACGERLPFKDESFWWIISCHSLEHMENTFDTLCEWLRALKPGGIAAIIMPDRNYGPFNDPSHKHEYTPDEFFTEILMPLVSEGKIEILEYDTFKNHFSFNCLLRKI